MNKYRYFALVTASALALGGCDKISSFFGGDSKSEEFVQRIEPSKDDGSVGMLLPDFAQLVQNEGQAVVNIQASPAGDFVLQKKDFQLLDQRKRAQEEANGL